MSTSSITPHRRDISASQRSGFSSQHEAGRGTGSLATLSSMRRPTSTLRLPSNQCLPPNASAPGARSSRSDSPVLGPRVVGGAMRSFVRGVSGSNGALGRKSWRVVRQSQKTSPMHDRCAGSRTGTLAPIQHPAAHPSFSSFHCRLNTDELEASATFDAPGHMDASRRHEGRMCSSSASAARAPVPAASTDRPHLSRSLPPPSSGCAFGALKQSDAMATSTASRSSGTITEDANSHSFLSSLEEHFLQASAVTNDEDMELSSVVGQNGVSHHLQSKRLRRNSAGQACDMLLDAGTGTGSSVRSVDDLKLAEVEALMGRLMFRWRHLRGSELPEEMSVKRPAAAEPTAAASTMAAAAAPGHAAPSLELGGIDGEDDAFKERIMRFLETQHSQYFVEDTAGSKRTRPSLPSHKKRVQALDDDACEGEIAAALKRGVQGAVSANPFTMESIEERLQNGGARVPHDKMFMSRLDGADACDDELEDDMSPLGSVSACAYSARLGIEIEEGSMGQSSCSSPVSLTEGGSWVSCHRSCSPTGAGRLKQGSEVYKHGQQRPVNPAMPRKVKAIRSPIVTTEVISPARSKSVASLCSPRSAFSPPTPRSCTSSAC